MVYPLPDDEKRWQKYAELRVESLRMYGDIRLATEFCGAARELMDAGG